MATVINGITPATGSIAIYSLLELLITAGATKTRDSDGTTYSATGERVTSGASGANGLGNTSAWFVARLANGREYCFQRGASSTVWRIMYSAAAGFTGGSPGATRVPTATDQALVFGGGTDASPTYNNLLAADGTYRFYAYEDAVHGVWFGTVATSGGANSSGTYFDNVTPTFATDPDPHVINVSPNGFTAASIGTQTAATTGARTAGWLDYGEVEGAYVAMSGMGLRDNAGTVIYPNGAGTNPHNGKDQLRLIPYARGSAQTVPYGDKGTSQIVAWAGSVRSSLEMYSIVSDRDWIRMGDAVLRWNGDVVVVP